MFTELWKTGREGPWEITQLIQATSLNLSLYLVWFKQHQIICYQDWITLHSLSVKNDPYICKICIPRYFCTKFQRNYFCYSVQTSLKAVVLHRHLFRGNFFHRSTLANKTASNMGNFGIILGNPGHLCQVEMANPHWTTYFSGSDNIHALYNLSLILFELLMFFFWTLWKTFCWLSSCSFLHVFEKWLHFPLIL